MARAKSSAVNERIAVLETHAAHSAEALAALQKQVEVNSQVLAEINTKISRQKGFIGGAMFIVSALWAAVVAGVGFFLSRPSV